MRCGEIKGIRYLHNIVATTSQIATLNYNNLSAKHNINTRQTHENFHSPGAVGSHLSPGRETSGRKHVSINSFAQVDPTHFTTSHNKIPFPSLNPTVLFLILILISKRKRPAFDLNLNVEGRGGPITKCDWMRHGDTFHQ